MARSQGQVLERLWKSGRGYALRFPARGERQYLTLGLETDGWTRKRAEEELQNILADVRRGIWIAPDKHHRGSNGDNGHEKDAPLFGPFARGLVAARQGEVSDNTHGYQAWALTHLLPYFADWPVEAIDIEAVDAYRRHKVEQADLRRRAIERRKPQRDDHGRVLRPLAPNSINKTIEILQSILATAVEYGHLATNPAAGRRRRLKLPPRRPVHLDTAEQIIALLDACGEMDRDPHWRTERPPRDHRHPRLRRAARPRALPRALARRRPRQRPHPHRPLKDPSRPARDHAAACPARRARRPQGPRLPLRS